MNRTRLLLSLPLAAAALIFPLTSLRAQADPRQEARLSYLEGKFKEADAELDKAGAEVSGDLELRAQLVEAATKFLKGKTGEQRIPALEALQRCWSKIAEGRPDDPNALGNAVAAAKELAELDIAGRRPDQAKARAAQIITLADKIGTANASPDAKAALGEAYGIRAAASRKPNTIDAAIADYDKGATLLVEAAAGHAKEGQFLGAAAQLRLEEALFIHDTIPLETEKRDDAAMTAAVELSTRACGIASAQPTTFDTHLKVLHTARGWKMPGLDLKVFMTPLTPPVEGIALQVPKGTLWKRGDSKDWALNFDRNFEGDLGGVQILLKPWSWKEGYGGRGWKQIEEVVQSRWEGYQGEFSEVIHETKPVRLGGKKGPEIWHVQIGGVLTQQARPVRRAEWYWLGKEVTWQLRVLDWRRPSDVEDADIAAFVNAALGVEGLWPNGGADEKDDGKPKKPTKPTKKK